MRSSMSCYSVYIICKRCSNVSSAVLVTHISCVYTSIHHTVSHTLYYSILYTTYYIGHTSSNDTATTPTPIIPSVVAILTQCGATKELIQ